MGDRAAQFHGQGHVHRVAVLSVNARLSRTLKNHSPGCVRPNFTAVPTNFFAMHASGVCWLVLVFRMRIAAIFPVLCPPSWCRGRPGPQRPARRLGHPRGVARRRCQRQPERLRPARRGSRCLAKGLQNTLFGSAHVNRIEQLPEVNTPLIIVYHRTLEVWVHGKGRRGATGSGECAL